MTAWIKTSTNGDIISWGVHVGGRRWLLQLNINANEGVVGALRLSPINGFITGSTNLRDGQWHHIACVLTDDGSPNTEDVKLYVDGKAETISDLLPVDIDTGNLDGLNDPLRPVQIGARIPQTAGSPLYFNGWIDEVRIYNQDLSAGEIAILAN